MSWRKIGASVVLALTLVVMVMGGASAAAMHPHVYTCDKVLWTRATAISQSTDSSMWVVATTRVWGDNFGHFCERLQPMARVYSNNVYDWGDWEYASALETDLYTSDGVDQGGYANWGIDWQVSQQDSGNSFYYYGPYIDTRNWNVAVQAHTFAFMAESRGDGTNDTSGGYNDYLTLGCARYGPPGC